MSSYGSTLDVIGNTPVVQLRSVVPEGTATVLVKLEYLNPTGSYKDRMARAIIEGAEQRGDLKAGVPVVEYTGGSTGSSLAFVCSVKGYRLLIVTSDAFASEKLKTIAAFGGELIIVPSEGGKITPDLIPRMVERAKQIAVEEGAYATDQFNNRDALLGYHGIAQEVLAQVDEPIDAFCGGIGTGGMLVGVAQAFKAAGRGTRMVGLEPASAPLLTTGRKGSHHIEGTGVGIVPPLLRGAEPDQLMAIDEGEARTMARRLAREEGIFAGTSTGMNVVAAIKLAEELGSGTTVVTVAVDSGLKYLAGDLYETAR
jgi:cysteine synthase A